MNRVIQLRQNRSTLLEQASALNALESLSDEQRSEFDGLMAQVETINAAIEREERIAGGNVDVAQRALAQADTPEVRSAPAVQPRRTADNAEAIFARWVRTGDPGAHAELRASNDTDMNVTTAADGGNLVPTGHYNQIIERLRPQSLPDLLGARLIPGTGITVNVPIDNEADDGAFVSTAESAAFDRDAPAVNKVAMTLVKYTKKIDLTYELLASEDSQLLPFLAGYVADGMAATLNKLLVTEALASGTAAFTAADDVTLAETEIPKLIYALPARYSAGQNVALLMKRTTEGVLRGKSGSPFLFAPTPAGAAGPGNGVTSSLFGVPVYTDDNMGAIAASGKSLLIGNWGYMGYRLAPALTLIRDPYTRSSYGEVVLNYHFQAVFKVLQAGAFQYVTQAAS